jgi:hypothetical protein
MQCSLAVLGRKMTLQTQGRCGFDGIAGSGHRGLREDDDVVGPGTERVISVTGSGTARGAQRCGLREDDVVAGSGTASRAWG